MPDPSSRTPNLFERLPPELVTRIYVHTGNTQLPLTCRYLYRSLNNSSAYIAFCTHLFHPYSPLDHETIKVAQTQVFSRQWFTAEIAEQVEAACRKGVCARHQRLTPWIEASVPLPSYPSHELIRTLLRWFIARPTQVERSRILNSDDRKVIKGSIFTSDASIESQTFRKKDNWDQQPRSGFDSHMKEDPMLK